MSCASLGKPDKAAASVADALAGEEEGDVVEAVEDDSVVEEDAVVDDVSVVEAAPGSLTPKSCAATWLTRRRETRSTDMEYG